MQGVLYIHICALHHLRSSLTTEAELDPDLTIVTLFSLAHLHASNLLVCSLLEIHSLELFLMNFRSYFRKRLECHLIRTISTHTKEQRWGLESLDSGLESDSSPDLAGLGLGLESFTSGLGLGLGLGLETCGLGLDSDSDRRDSTGLGKLHR